MSPIVVFAAVAALLATPAVAAPTLRPPTGKWVVNFADHQCTATRAFGTADKPLHFVIKPSPGGEVTQIALIEKGQNFDGYQDEATLELDGAKKLRTTQLSYGLSKKNFRLINLDAAQAVALGQTTSLRWGGSGDALDLGPMTNLMTVLEDCRRDLRRYWNIGPENHNGRISGPRPAKSLISYFSADDYPSQALSKGQQGVTGFILLIDEQGRPRDCMVEQTSGIATLDIMACLVFKKSGKFSPALDRAGKPVKGAFSQRVKWVLPDN